MLWGLCAKPDDPEKGYREFFQRWPQWRVEEVALDENKAWASLERKLGSSLVNCRIADNVQAALGDLLLDEIEGRILYTLARNYKARHGGILRAPTDLSLFAEYDRPEIVRHFGVHYDPAKHNTGILWFEDQCAVIAKLDASGAVVRHHYLNRFLSTDQFSWTSEQEQTAGGVLTLYWSHCVMGV